MGRPRSFDQSKLLNQAMMLFWSKGYHATSVRDIAKISGITTGTIYNEFDGKDGLFSAILDHYLKYIITPRVEQILLSTNLPSHLSAYTSDTPRGRISHYLISSFHDLPPQFAYQACLLINTELELSLESNPKTTIQKAAQKGLQKIREGFEYQIQLANKIGDLLPNNTPKSVLDQLEVFMIGLLITAKAKQESLSLIPTIQHFLNNLFEQRGIDQ